MNGSYNINRDWFWRVCTSPHLNLDSSRNVFYAYIYTYIATLHLLSTDTNVVVFVARLEFCMSILASNLTFILFLPSKIQKKKKKISTHKYIYFFFFNNTSDIQYIVFIISNNLCIRATNTGVNFTMTVRHAAKMFIDKWSENKNGMKNRKKNMTKCLEKW